MNGREWTEQEIAFLLREQATRSLTEIGEILGRTYSAVKSKRDSIRYPKQPKPIKTDDMQVDIRIYKLGKYEQIPPIPGLLEHLMSMSGSMGSLTDYSLELMAA